MNYLFYTTLQLYYFFEHWFLKLVPFKRENSILFVRLDAIGDSIIWLDSAKKENGIYQK